MNRNQEITTLANEIMVDITDNRLPLYNILLKASRLSLLLDMSDNVKVFQEQAKYAEQNQFIVENYKINLESAKDVQHHLHSSNPNQYLQNPMGNHLERLRLKQEAQQVMGFISTYRTQVYNFASNIYAKWQFGNIAETIFEKKRIDTEEILKEVFPDINNRLNSIEQNIFSDNPEDWKNAVASCRTLLMDLADKLNPAEKGIDKQNYINRLQAFISEKGKSKTKNKLVKIYLEETKKRIEYTTDLTQGGSHKDRPLKKESENIVLYTYLIIADLMEINKDKKTKK